jgi:hypothetical protein
MAWKTEGAQVNPAAGTVLADSGPKDGAGSLAIDIIASASVVAFLLVQHRNATNTATIREFQMRLLANGTFAATLGNEEMEDQERIRIVMGALALGQVQAMLTM